MHATSMAGPYGGGAKNAVHSVAMHDLLWRDEPGVSTPSGIRFHDRPTQVRSPTARSFACIVTSPGLTERLVDEGIDASRIRYVRLGVGDDSG